MGAAVRRTILTLAAVLAATAAHAQELIHPKKIVDPEAGLPGYKRKYMPPDDPIGDIPPGWTLGSANPLAGLQSSLNGGPPRITHDYG